MKFNQHNKYPRIGALIRNYISLIDVFSPKVFEAFKDACDDPDLARQAITYNENPEIRIVKLINAQSGYEDNTVGGQYSGECYPAKRNIVYINKNWVIGYENHSSEDGDVLNWIIVERAILHEMVHWARFVGGKPARIFDKKTKISKEAGNSFEHEAYGYATGDHTGRACN